MKVDGYRPPWSNFFVIRIILALAWFGVSLSGMAALAGFSGFTLFLSVATAAPVFLAALLYRLVGPWFSFITDTTGILYAFFMVHLFLSVDISADGLNAVVFFVYPVGAIMVLTVEAGLISFWKHFRHRSSAHPADAD
jgi:hypothetical protein